ncbi:hypothetical protein [Hyphococcus sp.]|uniref:hypothetical protein n=1 Tax=Hyphococcus sp. TaxID=2038636 RepID=UPI003CCC436C
MNEAEFDALIDCKFPYNDAKECMRLINLAAKISPEASFMVLHEICRPPKDATVLNIRLSELLTEWRKTVTHPLRDRMFECAQYLIGGGWATVDFALQLIREIEKFPGQYSALNIAYFCCDDESGKIENEYERIRSAWNI